MLSVLSLALALVAQVPDKAPATLTLESLIPAHTFAVVRAKSLDRLAELLLPFQRLGDEQAAPLDVLGMLGGQFDLNVKWDLVDHSVPILFAVSSSAHNQPAAFSLIAHARDAAKLAADPKWKRSGWTCSVHGDFVVVATEPSDSPLASDSPLFTGLDAGDLVVRVDFQEVLAQYGEEYRAKLRSGLDNDVAPSANEEQLAAAEKLLDDTFDLADAIETFGISLREEGQRMRLGLDLTGMPKSMLVDVAKIDTKPLAKLVRCIDAQAPLTFVGAVDFSKWTKGMQSLMELAETFGAESAPTDVHEWIANASSVYEVMGACSTGSVNFGRDGITATYGLQPTNIQKLIEVYPKMFALKRAPIVFEGPTVAQVAGHEVTRYRVKIDPHLAPGIPELSQQIEARNARVSEALTKMFGGDAIPFAYAQHEGTLIATAGAESEMEVALARASEKTTASAGNELLALLGPLNPGMALRFDTRKCVSSGLEFASRMVGQEAPQRDAIVACFKDCAPVTLAIGLDQRTWRFTLETDVVRLARAIASVPHQDVNAKPSLPEADEVQDGPVTPPK